MFATHELTRSLLGNQSRGKIYDNIEELYNSLHAMCEKYKSMDYTSSEKILGLVEYKPGNDYKFSSLNQIHIFLVMDMIIVYFTNITFTIVCCTQLVKHVINSKKNEVSMRSHSVQLIKNMLKDFLAWIDEEYDKIMQVYIEMWMSYTTKYGSDDDLDRIFYEKEQYIEYLEKIVKRKSSGGNILIKICDKLSQRILAGKF